MIQHGIWGYGSHHFWATPTDSEPDVGTYHLSTVMTLDQHPVTMAVNGQNGFTLHATYPLRHEKGAFNLDGPTREMVRFTGTETLPVVDAGYGRKQDFAGLDVQGKLVLLRLHQTNVHNSRQCTVDKAELINALHAGAAGVLIDPSKPHSNFNPPPAKFCTIPTFADWWGQAYGTTPGPPPIPYVSIPPNEASHLRDLLAQGGPAKVTVHDNGPSPYRYNIAFFQEGAISKDLHHTVTADELSHITSDYQASTAVREHVVLAAFRPNSHYVGGVVADFSAPASNHVMFGPVSPAVVWSRKIEPEVGEEFAKVVETQRDYRVFDRRGARHETDWNQRPFAPGAAAAWSDAFRAQPGQRSGAYASRYCAFCRQGNTFYAASNLISGGHPKGAFAQFYGEGSIHLYHNGEEVSPTFLFGRMATYQLLPERAEYRLTTSAPAKGYGHRDTTWHFTSAEVTEDETPQGALCVGRYLGRSSDPCAATPLVFLRYDAGLDLHNTAPAPGAHRFTVTAYHEATDAPAITGLKLWTSVDGGDHWGRARVIPKGRSHGGEQTFDVIAVYPKLSKTDGTVSIKATATDAAGNSIKQVLTDAFKLRPRGHGHIHYRHASTHR